MCYYSHRKALLFNVVWALTLYTIYGWWRVLFFYIPPVCEYTCKIRFPKSSGRNFVKTKETATENTINSLISVAFYFLKDFKIHIWYGFRVSEIYSHYAIQKSNSVSISMEKITFTKSPAMIGFIKSCNFEKTVVFSNERYIADAIEKTIPDMPIITMS